MLTRTDLSICIVSVADKAEVALYGLTAIHELAVLEEFSWQLRCGQVTVHFSPTFILTRSYRYIVKNKQGTEKQQRIRGSTAKLTALA
jgi:hypothetical protein